MGHPDHRPLFGKPIAGCVGFSRKLSQPKSDSTRLRGTTGKRVAPRKTVPARRVTPSPYKGNILTTVTFCLTSFPPPCRSLLRASGHRRASEECRRIASLVRPETSRNAAGNPISPILHRWKFRRHDAPISTPLARIFSLTWPALRQNAHRGKRIPLATKDAPRRGADILSLDPTRSRRPGKS